MLRFSKQHLKGKIEQGIEREGIWLLRNYLKTHVQNNRSLCNKNVGTWATSVGFNVKTAEDKYLRKNESNTSVCCFWMYLVHVATSFLFLAHCGSLDWVFAHFPKYKQQTKYDGKIFTILIKKGNCI